MAWGSGMFEGREVGYLIEAPCDHEGCEVIIDRGVSQMCGGAMRIHGPENDGCGKHFCNEHLCYAADLRPGAWRLGSPQLCPACVELWDNHRLEWATELAETDDLPICGWPGMSEVISTLTALDEHIVAHPEVALRWIDPAAIAAAAVRRYRLAVEAGVPPDDAAGDTTRAFFEGFGPIDQQEAPVEQ